MKKMFEGKYIKKYDMPFWKKVLFMFLKTHRAVDMGGVGDQFGGKDKAYVLEFKKWRGVTYLVREWTFTLD